MNLNEKVLSYAKQRKNKKVGLGECWDLVEKALKKAKAYTSRDYDANLSSPDYTWGTQISITDVRPGDLIQFRDYWYSASTDTGNGGGEDEWGERPHHSAIVGKVEGNGVIWVYEQNANGVRKVKYNKLYFMTYEGPLGGVSTSVEVGGQFWFYRPEANVDDE
jgi:hypothetical protein